MPKLLRLRVPFGFAFAAWYLVVARPASWTLLVACILLVAAGAGLRSWAAGYLFKGKRLAVGGPYAFVRNPLYCGSFLMGLGFCVVLWHQPVPVSSVILWLAFLVGFGIVYLAKSKSEEGELAAALGDPYLRYAGRVPAFLPVRGRVGGLGDQRFSRELYRRNREWQCIAGCLAILLFLVFRFLHPGPNAEASIRLAQAAEEPAAGSPEVAFSELDQQLFTARQAARAGRYDVAIKTCEQILKKDDRNLDALKIMASSYYLLNEPERSRHVIQRALEISPDDEQLQKFLTRLPPRE